jgi:molybdopterin-guanine dinucleotide biosynthesis protein A
MLKPPRNGYPMAEIIGLALAGGRGRRLGGIDKGWHIHQGKPLIEHALEHLKDCQRIIISANRHLSAYRQLGYAVVADQRPDYQGPLSGIESAMRYAPDACFYVMPCDLLGVPPHWLSHLTRHARQTDSPWVGTQTADKLQPLLGLWSTRLFAELTDFLDAGERRVMHFVAPYQKHALPLPDQTDLLNINTLL